MLRGIFFSLIYYRTDFSNLPGGQARRLDSPMPVSVVNRFFFGLAWDKRGVWLEPKHERARAQPSGRALTLGQRAH